MNTKTKLLSALIATGIITTAAVTFAARPWYSCFDGGNIPADASECARCSEWRVMDDDGNCVPKYYASSSSGAWGDLSDASCDKGGHWATQGEAEALAGAKSWTSDDNYFRSSGDFWTSTDYDEPPVDSPDYLGDVDYVWYLTFFPEDAYVRAVTGDKGYDRRALCVRE